jgi:hypothetical protein
MLAELQTLATALATRLDRAVAIDDPELRLLVHTPHHGELDQARLDSLVKLAAPDWAVSYVKSLGVDKATGPVRVPGLPDKGLLPRLCVPIRSQRLLLGYLWLIDEDGLDQAGIEDAARTAVAAGTVMFRERLIEDLQRGRDREAVRDLLSEDLTVRTDAAALLRDEGRGPTGCIIGLVVEVRGDVPDDLRLVLDTALDAAGRRCTPRSPLYLARGIRGVLLVEERRPVGARDELVAVAEQLRADVSSAAPGGHVFVGMGGRSDDLEGAVHSERQARAAIEVAAIVPGFPTVVDWADLGVYQVLVQLPLDQLAPAAIPSALLRLFELDKGGQLVSTLECYLDHAGDPRSTIAVLNIHRTSLYYRLSRIGELTGIDLSDGGDRLAVHLGLKLARLAGRHPASPRGAT